MAGIGAIFGLIGTGLQVMGTIQQGRWAKAQAEYEAKAAEAKGKEEFAAKQREGLEKVKEAEYAASRARAIAAGSGAGGVETPSVANTIADIWTQGDYGQRVAVYEGESLKRGRYDQAALARARGKAAYQGSLLSGFAKGISGFSKAYG